LLNLPSVAVTAAFGAVRYSRSHELSIRPGRGRYRPPGGARRGPRGPLPDAGLPAAAAAMRGGRGGGAPRHDFRPDLGGATGAVRRIADPAGSPAAVHPRFLQPGRLHGPRRRVSPRLRGRARGRQWCSRGSCLRRWRRAARCPAGRRGAPLVGSVAAAATGRRGGLAVASQAVAGDRLRIRPGARRPRRRAPADGRSRRESLCRRTRRRSSSGPPPAGNRPRHRPRDASAGCLPLSLQPVGGANGRGSALG
jgi:hypothetical protein